MRRLRRPGHPVNVSASPRAKGKGVMDEKLLVSSENRFWLTAEKWKEKTWESNAVHNL